MSKQGKVILAAFGVMLLAVAIFTIAKAHAQPDSFCAPIEGFDGLMEKYHEKQMFAYRQPSAQAVKIMYANPLTGDWTLIAVGMDRRACTVAHGDQMVRRATTSEIRLHPNDTKLEPES